MAQTAQDRNGPSRAFTFGPLVLFTASVTAGFGVVVLWLTGATGRPGIRGLAVAAVAYAGFLESCTRLKQLGNGSIVAGIRVATHAATAAGAAWFGVALSLPLWGLHGRSVPDSDSERILASVSYVRRYGPGLLRRSQEPLLPHLFYRIAVSLGGLSGARVVPILCTMVLAAVVGGIAFSLTHRLFGTAVAVVALLGTNVVLTATAELPLYALVLSFGYLAGFCSLRALRAEDERTRMRYAICVAVCIALTFESQGTGQLFLLAPGLVIACMALTVPRRQAIRTFFVVYIATGIALLPRLAINLSEGGIHHVVTSRNEFMVTQGYLTLVNRFYWNNRVHIAFVSYLRLLPKMLSGALALGTGSAVLIVLFVIAGVRAKWSARVLVVLAGGLLAVALARTQPPPFVRYTSALLPGIALVAAVGAVALVQRPQIWRAVAVVALALITTAGLSNMTATAGHFQTATLRFRSKPASLMRPRITDHRPIIGVRSTVLAGVDPNLVVFGTPFLSEDEWKTFLLWPSDQAVLAMFKRHDIGWVYISENRRLEIDYSNTWTVRAYGKTVQMQTRIEKSPHFCRRYGNSDGFAALYEVGACPSPGASVSTP